MRASVLRWALAIVTLLVLILLIWPSAPKENPGVLSYIPKCPTHPLKLQVVQKDTSETLDTTTVTSIALAGDRADVVEVHDCQRFVVAPAGASAPAQRTYGPLEVIFASNALPTLFDNAAGGARGPAAAAIWSWWKPQSATGDYPALGIKGGWNCLYLARSGGEEGQVDGWMVPVDSAPDCLKPRNETGHRLKVHASPPPAGLTPDDIPAVARWSGDFSTGGKTHHIWIRCGGMSCEVGPPGFKPEAPLPAAVKDTLRLLAAGDPHIERVLEFRGWYDQQLLAISFDKPELEVGKVLATLIPDPSLGDKNSDAEFNTWQRVGFAYLPDPIPTYSEKLNFEQGFNVVYVRRGPLEADLPSNEKPRNKCPDLDPTAESTPWWTMIESPSGVKRYFCSLRYMHTLPPELMPGTVRWKWLDTDEKTWIRCPQGCCPIV